MVACTINLIGAQETNFMSNELRLKVRCDRQSLAEAVRILTTLLPLYPEAASPEDGDDLPAGVPVELDPPPPSPLTTAAGNPEDFVEAWLGHLGEGSRKFWRIAARYAVDHPLITFEDLARSSGLSRETLRSYHRNSYRAIGDEKAPDPMPGTWSQVTKRTEYSMAAAVRDKILELTEDDPT
jgi:hypothetical protein